MSPVELVLTGLAVWVAGSIPAALILGRLLKAADNHPNHEEHTS